MSRSDNLHPLQCLQAALCLACFGRLGAETVDITADMGNFPLLFAESGLLVCETFSADHFECTVVTGIEGYAALFDMGDMAGYRIQKSRSCEIRSNVPGSFEPLFKPDNGIQVEMIGRFIQQQQVGAAHQCARQV